MRRIVLLAIVLSGCAAAPRLASTHYRAVSGFAATEARPDGASAELVCSYEQRTGSHIATTVCRHPEDVAEERTATQAVLSMPRQSRGRDVVSPGAPPQTGTARR